MATWEPMAAFGGIKMFYYPWVNVYDTGMDLGRHIKHIPTICLIRDFEKTMLYGQFKGELFSHCIQTKVIPSRTNISRVMANVLFWAQETLPEDETVLIPSSGAGAYSYWSNPDSAVLARLSLT